MFRDLVSGFRTLGKNPGFAAVVILTLALGIGANTAIFSVVYAVLLRPLPFSEPAKLAILWESNPAKGLSEFDMSPANFLDRRDQSHAFSDMAATRVWFYTLAGHDEPEQVWGARVSWNFFRMLGVRPALGRWFLPEEEQPGRDQVVMLTDALWRRRYGADPAIVGRSILVDGRPMTVVGVLPGGFRFSNREYPIWMPLPLERSDATRGEGSLIAYGRLNPEAGFAEAQAEADAISKRLEQAYPKTNAGWRTLIKPLPEEFNRRIRPALLVLVAAVGFVLLISCTNVANLLLARAAGRQREMAVRAALGASRSALIRQILSETLPLALLGGAAGLGVAVVGLRLLGAAFPLSNDVSPLPALAGAALDPHALGFTLGLSFLTALLCGLAPAIFGARWANLYGSLRATGAAAGRSRTSRLLVVSEITLAAMLLAGGGLLMRSFLRLQSIDRGISLKNVLTMRIWLPPGAYADDAKITAFYRRVLEGTRALPGVEAAGAISFLPLSNWGDSTAVMIEGRPAPPPDQDALISYRLVDPGYFPAMNVGVVKGRLLQDQDREGAAGAVLINETMARRFWPNEDPVGQRLMPSFVNSDAPWRPRAKRGWLTVAGVVKDVKESGVGADDRTWPEIYLPMSQSPSPLMSLVIRTSGDPLRLAAPVRRQIRAVDPDQPVSYVRTMEDVVANSLWRSRLSLWLMAIFAGVALLLAAIGLYGVMSYTVNRQAREIGLRMALGAQPGDVLRMVVKQGLAMVMAGTVIGVVAALAASRLLSGLLFGVTSSDPWTYVSVGAVLGVTALAASYVPARRAARVDPMKALREE